jgi:hypothetical protein
MNFTSLVAIAGMPGIYKVISNKGGGIVVEDLKEKKRQFVSGRQGTITPLDTIFIFVDDAEIESTPLKNIYTAMLTQAETQPVPNNKASDMAIKSYFYSVYPTLDKERVYVSDMKKMLKWFNYLNEAGALILTEDEETTTQAVENATPASEPAE